MSNAYNDVPAADGGQQVQLGIRLQAGNAADHPMFSNFTAVQAAPGVVFVDFGFLEPNMLAAIAQLAESGGQVPQSVTGRLAARLALSPEAALQLLQQLEHQLRGNAAAARAQRPVLHTAPR